MCWPKSGDPGPKLYVGCSTLERADDPPFCGKNALNIRYLTTRSSHVYAMVKLQKVVLKKVDRPIRHVASNMSYMTANLSFQSPYRLIITSYSTSAMTYIRENIGCATWDIFVSRFPPHITISTRDGKSVRAQIGETDFFRSTTAL